jgi:hypothetical protein
MDVKLSGDGRWLYAATFGRSVWRLPLSVSVTQGAGTSGGAMGAGVAATLSVSLGAAPSFGAFTPGVAKDYLTSTTATVTSTAGNAALIVQDASPFYTNHLTNRASCGDDERLSAAGPGACGSKGSFALPQELQVMNNAGAYQTMPAGLRFWGGPTSSEPVPVNFKQSIGANDGLRTGSYTKTLTFTLSTTAP